MASARHSVRYFPVISVWTCDITYIATDEGWLYLAGLKDVSRPEYGLHLSSQ